MRVRDHGFILIVVIWFAALFALAATVFTRAMDVHVRSTRNDIDLARAEFLADGAVSLALSDLLVDRSITPGVARFAADGSIAHCTIKDDAAVLISIQDMGGLVNLNMASEELMEALFSGLGASAESAQRAAASIIDYRDSDDQLSPNGAERAEYAEAGRPNGPKNGPLDTIEEVSQVAGIDTALSQRAMEYLTVVSGIGGIDSGAAPQALAALLAQDASNLSISSAKVPAEFAGVSTRRTFRLRTEAAAGDAAFVREVTVELPVSRGGAPKFLNWQRGVARMLPPETADQPSPCLKASQ